MERKGEQGVPETRPILHLRLHHLQLSCGCLTSAGFGGKLPWQRGSGLTQPNPPLVVAPVKAVSSSRSWS